MVLALLATLLLAVVASAPVDWLARRGLGRGKATALVAGTFGLALWLGWLLVVLAVEQQARQFADALPALLEDAGRRGSVGLLLLDSVGGAVSE